nr:MAG TPA: Plasma membrane calcium-transporting ATPase 1 protein, STRUCTURAL PROTEIN [Caudoviricetes sp.]
MILYIIVIALFVLVGVYVAYEIKRIKRIRKESTKLDSELYRRKDGNR